MQGLRRFERLSPCSTGDGTRLYRLSHDGVRKRQRRLLHEAEECLQRWQSADGTVLALLGGEVRGPHLR